MLLDFYQTQWIFGIYKNQRALYKVNIECVDDILLKGNKGGLFCFNLMVHFFHVE